MTALKIATYIALLIIVAFAALAAALVSYKAFAVSQQVATDRNVSVAPTN